MGTLFSHHPDLVTACSLQQIYDLFLSELKFKAIFAKNYLPSISSSLECRYILEYKDYITVE